MKLKLTTLHNCTYPKVAVRWFNQALCFYQSFCLVDSEILRNRHLRVAANRYLQSMTRNFKHTCSIITFLILTHLTTATFACTCIGKDKQTTENELNFVDLAVKGNIIAVANFDYYDTPSYSSAGLKYDPIQSGYLIRKYKVFTLVVDSKFKATKSISDTVQIVTGYGGGDCGYEFEIGKDYIIYAETWKEKTVCFRHRKRKDKKRVIETAIANKFYTDICRLTQGSNQKELTNLKRLTE